MGIPKKVTVVEVGPRDGLQNEPTTIPSEVKIAFINHLSQSGLKNIEATSFVSPKRIPQLADHREIMQKITRVPGVHYFALVPNLQGLEAALPIQIQDIAVFTAASETFSKKNTNCTIQESLTRIQTVIEQAKAHHIRVRGYISCVLGCPYEGKIDPRVVATLAKKLYNMGCYQISLGDTIGVGTPGKAQQLIKLVSEEIPLHAIAMHFHDTYDQALANSYASLENGITTFDSSAAGLGGCPYAPGATGNVATEDLLYMLHDLDIETGIDLKKIMSAGDLILDYLKKPTRSKVSQALKAKSQKL